MICVKQTWVWGAYKRHQARIDRKEHHRSAMYVCICKAVTDADIRNAVDDGVRNLRQLSQQTGCSTGCGRCASEARNVLRDARLERSGLVLDLMPSPQPA